VFGNSCLLLSLAFIEQFGYFQQERKGPQAQWRPNHSPDNSGFFLIFTETGQYLHQLSAPALKRSGAGVQC